MSCQKLKVKLDSSISGIKMYRCKYSEIHAKISLPIIQIEACEQVNIYLNNKTLNTKVSTTNTSATILNYPAKGVTDEQLETENEGSNWLMKPVPEVYTTTIVEDDRSLLTEGYIEAD